MLQAFLFPNKKVLLRERKRHTARRVVSTPSVVLTGYPPPTGSPPCPDLARGGTLPGYPPSRVPPGRVLPQQGTPLAGSPPPALPGRVSPPGWTWQGTPPPVSAPLHSGKCCKALWDMGTPLLGVDKLTKWNYYLPVRTTYTGGNKWNAELIETMLVTKNVEKSIPNPSPAGFWETWKIKTFLKCYQSADRKRRTMRNFKPKSPPAWPPAA